MRRVKNEEKGISQLRLFGTNFQARTLYTRNVQLVSIEMELSSAKVWLLGRLIAGRSRVLLMYPSRFFEVIPYLTFPPAECAAQPGLQCTVG
jgi:hypothetical protein